MILPDKYVTLSESFFGLSALILDTLLSENLTIDKLWNKFVKKYIKTSKINIPPTYQKFIYVLEYMFLTNLISYNDKGEILNENIRIKN
jgi:hypothetical protein